MDIKEIREMSASELEKAVKEQKEALFNLRFQHSVNQLDNPMKIVETRKTIARMLTVLREKQISENV
ncbi:MAG: 50S ribosomal protein L29 [Clostridiales bacterium]|nr:50S ribosomal protein L29 [Candidatus Coliplasma caballi]